MGNAIWKCQDVVVDFEEVLGQEFGRTVTWPESQ